MAACSGSGGAPGGSGATGGSSDAGGGAAAIGSGGKGGSSGASLTGGASGSGFGGSAGNPAATGGAVGSGGACPDASGCRTPDGVCVDGDTGPKGGNWCAVVPGGTCVKCDGPGQECLRLLGVGVQGYWCGVPKQPGEPCSNSAECVNDCDPVSNTCVFNCGKLGDQCLNSSHCCDSMACDPVQSRCCRPAGYQLPAGAFGGAECCSGQTDTLELAGGGYIILCK